MHSCGKQDIYNESVWWDLKFKQRIRQQLYFLLSTFAIFFILFLLVNVNSFRKNGKYFYHNKLNKWQSQQFSINSRDYNFH